MNLSEYGERYLTEKEFITLCNDCEIRVLSSSVDSKILKEFEISKVFLPNFIIKKSKGFAEYCFRNNSEYNSNLIFPSKYKILKETIDEYFYWHHNNSIYHPFDKERISTHIKIPGQHKYQNGDFKILINGNTISIFS